MLSAFIFTSILSVRHAAAFTPRQEQPSGTRSLARDGDDNPSNLSATIPTPGLQVAEHTTRTGAANQQASLISLADWASLTHVADAVLQWPGTVVALEHPQGIWVHPHGNQDPSLTATMSGHDPSDNGKAPNHTQLFDPIDFGKAPNHTQLLWALAGGTGASLEGTGRAVDRDLLRRMHYQDKAVMCLLLVIYFVALSFSMNVTWRQACNNSPVTYYADPRYQDLAMQGHDLDMFLDTFNQSPKNISLRVAGFIPVSEDLGGNVQWRGEAFQTAFHFALDLSPWMVKEDQTIDSTGSLQHTRTLHDGVLPEDRSSLNYVLNGDPNDLSYAKIVKYVRWPDWEELATNIKHSIRQNGFDGVISVDRPQTDELEVYKNKPWANFMYARATRVLCALSIFGWLIYAPYMWLRCKPIVVRSYYRVDVDISQYWPLVSEQLSAGGFAERFRSGGFPESRPAPTVSNV